MRISTNILGCSAILILWFIILTSNFFEITASSNPKNPEYDLKTDYTFDYESDDIVDIASPEKLLNKPEDVEENEIPSPPLTPVATAPGIITTRNFIYNERAKVTINSNYVNLVKPFDTTNLDELMSNLTHVETEHQGICLKMASLISESKYLSFGSYQKDHKNAAKFCSRRGMKLPEAHDFSETLELLGFMARHGFSEIHSGATYSRSRKNLVYSDGTIASSNIHICDSPPHEPTDITYWYYYNEQLKDAPNSFTITPQNTLRLCTNTHEMLPVVCMRESQIDNTTKQNLEFCNAKTLDISAAVSPLKRTIFTLNESVHPNLTDSTDSENFDQRSGTRSQARTKRHFQQLFTPLNTLDVMPNLAPFNFTRGTTKSKAKRKNITRPKRAIASGHLFLSFMSLVISLITYLSTTAGSAESATKIGTLKINTQTIAGEIDNLTRNVFHALDHAQEQQFLQAASQSTYSTFLRILLTLQDSITNFQSTIQSVIYNQISPQLLSSSQLQAINSEILGRTGTPINFDRSTYMVKPVILEGSLAVQISIPLDSTQKHARLYELQPYPFFSKNQKYLPVCDTQFVAFYEHDNSYNILSNDEYNHCKTHPSFCVARSPKYSALVPNCGTSEIFERNDHPELKHIRASDDSPFFHTSTNLTIFAVKEDTKIHFHCKHIKRVGPDMVRTLRNRGNFTNVNNCRFNTDFMSNDAPTPILLDEKATAISSQFPLPGPQIFHFPDNPIKHNIPLTNVTNKLINYDQVNPTLMNNHWDFKHVILITILCMATLFIIVKCCILKGKTYLRRVLANFATSQTNQDFAQNVSYQTASKSSPPRNICMDPRALEMAQYHLTHRSDPNLLETDMDDMVIVSRKQPKSPRLPTYSHQGEYAKQLSSPPTGPFFIQVTPKQNRKKIPESCMTNQPSVEAEIHTSGKQTPHAKTNIQTKLDPRQELQQDLIAANILDRASEDSANLPPPPQNQIGPIASEVLNGKLYMDP